MGNCLVTKLKDSVSNPNLPIFDTITQYALDKIAVAGDKTMTDDQKYWVSRFFNHLGGPTNSVLWQKIDYLFMPIISGTLNGAITNLKTDVKDAASAGTAILVNKGLVTESGTANINIIANGQVDPSSFSLFASLGSTIDDSTELNFTYSDPGTVSLSVTPTRMSLTAARQIAIYTDCTLGSNSTELLYTSSGITTATNSQSVYVRDINNANKLTTSSSHIIEERIPTLSGTIGAKTVIRTNPLSILMYGKAFTEQEAEIILEAATKLKKAFVSAE